MHNLEEQVRTQRKQRLGDRFNIDWSLNINSIIVLITLVFTLAHYGSQAVAYLKSIDAKTNIMWTHFDKNQLSKEELQLIIEK